MRFGLTSVQENTTLCN